MADSLPSQFIYNVEVNMPVVDADGDLASALIKVGFRSGTSQYALDNGGTTDFDRDMWRHPYCNQELYSMCLAGLSNLFVNKCVIGFGETISLCQDDGSGGGVWFDPGNGFPSNWDLPK